MGGTFDPIHRGHRQVAEAVVDALDLAEVIFVPAGDPWMKSPPQAAAEHRLAMVLLAIQGDPRFTASRVDIDRPGPTYAVDTLADLQATHPSVPGQPAQWSFIVGADALVDFSRWHDPERILQLADLVGVTRPGHVLDPGDIPAEQLTLLPVPSMDVASSEIRRRVSAGESIRHLVEPAVADYIVEHGLYLEAPR